MDRRYDAPSTDVRTDDPQVTDTPPTPPPPPPVAARTEPIVTRDPDPGAGIREARERFGGLDIPSILSGMLIGVAMLVILAGLASAAFGEIAFQTGVSGNQTELSLGALITAGVVLFLAFLTGGWAAARMARYSGALNGLMVAVTFLIFLGVLAALGAIVGDAYNLFDNLRVAKANLPNWFSADTVTTGAIVSAAAFVAVTFVGATLGGLWGGRFHRRADAVIASRAADEPRVTREDDAAVRRG